MDEKEKLDTYAEMLMASHNKLYGYIYSLTGRSDQADDILQETNRKLWTLRDEFDFNREFLPWAYTVAYNQVRAARSKISREKLVFQDEEVVLALANEQQTWSRNIDERASALELCLQRLSDKNKSIINKYYSDGYSMEEVGGLLQKSTGSIAVALHRIRLALADCIRGQLA